MIISVISVRSPHQVGIHVVESNNSLFPIISIIGVESTCRNFRPPFIGTFGRHSTELSAAVHRNFWAPFIGTFGRHLLELSTAIHWNFQPPFIETWFRRSAFVRVEVTAPAPNHPGELFHERRDLGIAALLAKEGRSCRTSGGRGCHRR